MAYKTLFADILLPLPVKGCFTYRVPRELNDSIQPGQRAVVPFGRKKVYAGLVKRIHETAPKGFPARYLHALLDEEPVVLQDQFRFWEWLAEYYLCTEGEVMQAALPPAMKLAGETRLAINPAVSPDEDSLNEHEYKLMQALGRKSQLSLDEAAAVTGLAKVFPLIKSLLEKGYVLLKEELENPWRPKIRKFAGLAPAYRDEESLRVLFDELEKRAPRQTEVLMTFFRLKGEGKKHKDAVPVQELTATISGGQAALSGLVKKGIFIIEERLQSRFEHITAGENNINFNEHQQQAWEEIHSAFAGHEVVLLHGITSSGKTEIYIRLIRECLERGEQVLYLLPEIALTTQIINRLQQQFGNRAGIYHSRFNPMERTEVWNNLLYGGIESDGEKISYDLVLGPRSALFLPFSNLGLIIVDEEHENGFKQQDPAPRYHARDAAIFMAKMFGAKVLLGSATPSVESFYNAQSGKYGYVKLMKRHGGVMLPEVLVADMKKESRQKTIRSHFSSLLLEHMKQALERKEQVILFQNRRGFSLRLECDTCNWLPECHQCDVSLVYHKKANKLKCHYCGYTTNPPAHCPECHSAAIKMKGFGTEKIEEELPLFFPDAVVKRMDLDTTRSKHAYRDIISGFENRQIDILIGTQMVSKGLDFNNVGLVGILNADNMLGFPDFRAHERAYQLMAQVSGRAGRDKKRGKVIIQSYNPWHSIIRQVIDNDYESMVSEQLTDRRRFHYPPFTRLLLLGVQHRDPEVLDQAADGLAASLRLQLDRQIFGPEYPSVSRVRNVYVKNILIKLKRDQHLPEAKRFIQQETERLRENKDWKQVRVVLDVDPL